MKGVFFFKEITGRNVGLYRNLGNRHSDKLFPYHNVILLFKTEENKMASSSFNATILCSFISE